MLKCNADASVVGGTLQRSKGRSAHLSRMTAGGRFDPFTVRSERLQLRRPPWALVAAHWPQADRPFERLEENAGGVSKKQFTLPDVPAEHGVRGMACLLPDLERGDACTSCARREAGAQAMS